MGARRIFAEPFTNAQVCKARDRALRQLRDRHRDECDELYRAELGTPPPQPCRICGELGQTRSNAVTCGAAFCVDAWKKLAYLVDEAARNRQLRATARWALENSEYEPERRRAREILDQGGEVARRRWLLEGSAVADVARQCVERELLIVAEFPPTVLTAMQSAASTES